MAFLVITWMVAVKGMDGTGQSFQFHVSQGKEVDQGYKVMKRNGELLSNSSESVLVSPEESIPLAALGPSTHHLLRACTQLKLLPHWCILGFTWVCSSVQRGGEAFQGSLCQLMFSISQS